MNLFIHSYDTQAQADSMCATLARAFAIGGKKMLKVVARFGHSADLGKGIRMYYHINVDYTKWILAHPNVSPEVIKVYALQMDGFCRGVAYQRGKDTKVRKTV
jgi:hypothetical protein